VKEDKVLSLEGPAEVDAKSPLEELLAQGARKMLQAAIENEVEEYVQAHRGRRTEGDRAAAAPARACTTARASYWRTRAATVR
jgi:hypothetical protein